MKSAVSRVVALAFVAALFSGDVYQGQLPFDEVTKQFDIRNEEERAALRQEYAATRAMYTRWQQDLLAAVPTARIVELPGASRYMFLSNGADVIRELRAMAREVKGPE